jgi:hypothetical protein
MPVACGPPSHAWACLTGVHLQSTVPYDVTPVYNPASDMCMPCTVSEEHPACPLSPHRTCRRICIFWPAEQAFFEGWCTDYYPASVEGQQVRAVGAQGLGEGIHA